MWYVYFMAIWNILRAHGKCYDHLLRFVMIWYIFPETSGNPGAVAAAYAQVGSQRLGRFFAVQRFNSLVDNGNEQEEEEKEEKNGKKNFSTFSSLQLGRSFLRFSTSFALKGFEARTPGFLNGDSYH
jgi:hypothetical protein